MHLILTLVTIVLCLVMFAVDHLLNGKRGENFVFTYDDNGKRVKIVVEAAPVIPQTEDCTPDHLKTCTMNDRFSCGSCNQPLAVCRHFDKNVTIEIKGTLVKIPRNTKPDEGYCLATGEDLNQRKCSQKHGGKWIMTTNDNQTLLRFECFCSEQGFFVNSPITGDCTVFVGCNNGTLKTHDWNTLAEIDCNCHMNYVSNYDADGQSRDKKYAAAPQCVEKNIFMWDKPPFPVLESKYIDKFYMSALGEKDTEVKLPNPCLLDLSTRTFIPGIGEIRLAEHKTTKQMVAYCVSLDEAYTTVVINDDYLLNNGGQYANGLVKFVNDRNKLKPGETVYEFFRTKINQEDEPLEGRRIEYQALNNIQLPYLEKESANTGGNGEMFTYAPRIPRDQAPKSYVYVFAAITPETVNIIIGEMLSYMPVYMPTGIEATRRVFNGVIAFKPFAHDNYYYAVWPEVPPNKHSRYFGTTGIMGPERMEGGERKFAEHFCLPIKMNGEMNPYSRLNTGTLLKYTIKNQIYNKPISANNDLLTQKYRRSYNKDYDVIPPGKYLKFYRHLVLPADEHDVHLFTENSVGYELNDLGCGETKYSRYKIQNKQPVFLNYYN